MRAPQIKNVANIKKIILIILVGTLCFVIIQINFKKPSHDRNWDPEFARFPEITIENNIVNIKNLRDWKEGGDPSKNHLDVEVDANKIERVWFLFEPFGKFDGIAHTYITFDFEDRDPISLSIEARREVGETYDGLRGVFKEYELIYMWGTERDFLLRRVYYLGNPVYMVPLNIDKENAGKLFLSLAKSTRELEEEPRFYNTLFSNCTNVLADEVNKFAPNALPWDIARILTGKSPEYLTKHNRLEGVTNWEEEKGKYFVNPILDSIGQENFSKPLREKLTQ